MPPRDETPAGRPGALVVLGACFANRHPALLRTAARRGLTVLGVDTLNPLNAAIDAARRRETAHPLAALAEMAWVPGERTEDVLDQVLSWSGRYDVRAAVALGETYVEAASVVADCLALRGPGMRASRVCRDKLLQRRFLADWSPRSRLVPPEARAETAKEWDSFPAVVKPVGRTASSGVRRATDASGLGAALDSLPRVESALVETYVEGRELSVESLVADGRVVFAAPTGKRTNEQDGAHFVEMGHTVPDSSLSAAERTAVLAANAAVLARLGFADGAAHAEFRVEPSGSVTLMEIAARPAGDNIYALYQLATGVPLEETLLAILLGEAVAHPEPRRHARQVFLPHEPGVLQGVQAHGLGVPVCSLPERWIWPAVVPLRPDAPAAVHMVTASRQPGTELRPIRESWDRTAMFVIDAPSPAELDRLEARCRTAVHVEVGARERGR